MVAPTARGGPRSVRSPEEREEQARFDEQYGRVVASSPAESESESESESEELGEPELPAVGARRAVPCLGCLRSALAGRSAGSCFEQANPGRSKRCARCASGHQCLPVPALARRAATALVEALENDSPKAVSFSLTRAVLAY